QGDDPTEQHVHGKEGAFVRHRLRNEEGAHESNREQPVKEADRQVPHEDSFHLRTLLSSWAYRCQLSCIRRAAPACSTTNAVFAVGGSLRGGRDWNGASR